MTRKTTGNGNGRKKSKKKIETTESKGRRISGVTPVTEEQKSALRSITSNHITFIHGPAGSGKTHIAVHYGIANVLKNKYKHLVLTRPCVEAYGEKLGSLPGDADDKVAPYMSPLLYLLGKEYGDKEIKDWISEKIIVFSPLAYMRGITFDNCFVVADEMQNSSSQQMRLLLTRIGENCKMVVTGALYQSDISGPDGLSDAIERFKGIQGIGIAELTLEGIVRHPIIKIIEEGYGRTK